MPYTIYVNKQETLMHYDESIKINRAHFEMILIDYTLLQIYCV